MGADIVVAELDRANAEDTASELRGLGRRALVVQTDVTSRDDLRAMVERTLAELGRIDTLVNNAGIYRAAGAARHTSDTGASKKGPSPCPSSLRVLRRQGTETPATLGGKPPSSASISVP